MEELREKLYAAIKENGLDYEKVIEIDKKLHEEIIRDMRLCFKK